MRREAELRVERRVAKVPLALVAGLRSLQPFEHRVHGGVRAEIARRRVRQERFDGAHLAAAHADGYALRRSEAAGRVVEIVVAEGHTLPTRAPFFEGVGQGGARTFSG